jgi:hypothetical protein
VNHRPELCAVVPARARSNCCSWLRIGCGFPHPPHQNAEVSDLPMPAATTIGSRTSLDSPPRTSVRLVRNVTPRTTLVQNSPNSTDPFRTDRTGRPGGSGAQPASLDSYGQSRMALRRLVAKGKKQSRYSEQIADATRGTTSSRGYLNVLSNLTSDIFL